MGTFQALDWIVVGAYFLILLGIAIWSMRQKQDTSTEYFLAGRHVGWFVIGASIFASNIGAEHIVGLAGTAAKIRRRCGPLRTASPGWSCCCSAGSSSRSTCGAGYSPCPNSWSGATRPTARMVPLASSRWSAYVFTKICVTVYAGAVVFQTLMGIDFWTGAFIIVVMTGLYTVMGGMRAVMYTEALQTIVLILGSVLVTIIGLIKIGGWAGPRAGTPADFRPVPSRHPSRFSLDRAWSSPRPSSASGTGAPTSTSSSAPWRPRTNTQARRGTIFAAYLKLLPFFIFIIPGVIAYALSQSGKLALPSADQAFPTMVKALLPIGLRGLIAGGLLAALMSSLASVFNSCSTLFTIDIYKKLKPDASERKLVRVGRIATATVVVSGLVWIPLMKSISGELYHYLQSVQAYIAPPIAAVFLLGLFWKRINAAGALTSLIGGFVIGMLRLVAELNKNSLSGWLHTFATVNFLHFCIYLFLVCIAMMVTVSIFTPKPSAEKLNGLTYSTTMASEKAASRASWNYRDAALSAVVLIIVALVLVFFSPLVIAR